jgi:hypothetical protein
VFHGSGKKVFTSHVMTADSGFSYFDLIEPIIKKVMNIYVVDESGSHVGMSLITSIFISLRSKFCL